MIYTLSLILIRGIQKETPCFGSETNWTLHCWSVGLCTAGQCGLQNIKMTIIPCFAIRKKIRKPGAVPKLLIYIFVKIKFTIKLFNLESLGRKIMSIKFTKKN